MRQQVMDSVVSVLNERGYSALTISLITEQTGISSGAVTHHFPSKQRLLISTVEYAYATLAKYRDEQLNQLAPGLPRFRALIDLSYQTSRMPAGFAVNEVRIGARSDAELAAMLRPMFTRIALEYGRYVAAIVRDAGMEPNAQVQGLWTATSMAMRSLAIDRKTYARPDVMTNTLVALRKLRETIITEQLGPSKAQDPTIAWQPATGRKR